MRLSRLSLILFSGFLWFAIGFFLLIKGLQFVLFSVYAIRDASSFSLIGTLGGATGGKEQAALLLIALALFLGYLKGKKVLVKSVKRVVERILSLPLPIKLKDVYSPFYYLLILSMVGLGLLLKSLHLPEEIRGVIDVAIGSALMNGSLLYFRCALTLNKGEKKS